MVTSTRPTRAKPATPATIPDAKRPRRPEIMAPAGDFTCLQAAVQAGADAVYLGVDDFNMRANAGNFRLRDLERAAVKAHEAGIRLYLTLNTLMLPADLPRLHKVVTSAARAGIYAIIAWDFAAITAAQAAGLPVFLSTQMSVANAPALLFFYRRLGIRRFVLARECSLSDLAAIRRDLAQELGPEAERIELEVFAHGAMCLSVSGRCQLSQFHYGTSANRGACRQPCRREFVVTETRDQKSFLVGDSYTMSPKDLCTAPFLDQLLEAGIDSLKIEGRQRSPEYVWTVTRAYRSLVDCWIETRGTPAFAGRWQALQQQVMPELAKVFNRGFSAGFYLGRPLAEWAPSGGTQATHRKEYLGEVCNYFQRPGVAEIRIDAGSLRVGQEIMIQGPTTGVVQGPIASIEEHYARVEAAERGATVGVAFPHRVRKGDKVYHLVPATGP